MMPTRNTLWVALCFGSFCVGASSACDSKTPVPFKRGGETTGPEAALAKLQRPVEAAPAPSVYPDGTQKIHIGDTLIERPGTIRASWARDVDGDGQADLLLITTDNEGHAALETVLHGTTDASTSLALAPYATATTCRAIAGSIASLGTEQALASVDYLCDPAAATTLVQPSAAAPATAVPNALVPAVGVPTQLADPNAPEAQQAPPATAPELDLPPPEPSATVAQTHQFAIGLAGHAQMLLHLAVEPTHNGSVPLKLAIQGIDLDGDEHADIQVDVQITTASDAEPVLISLAWLNRPSGLARERREPEQTLQTLAQEALRLSDSKPQASHALASKALMLQRALCRETGHAELWVDEARGVSCGASSAAGKAAAARTIALAKQEALLPALEAHAALDSDAFQLDAKLRERVNKAIAGMRGDTSYRWQAGPPLRAPSSPNVRLSALGFIDEDHLLLRGPIAQSYELSSHSATPTGIPGSVNAADSSNRFVITDIARTCDGYHLHILPASQVIGGIVTGATTSEPLLQPENADPGTCSNTAFKKADRGEYTLLGMFAGGALFVHGATLASVPLDEQGRARGAAHILSPGEPAPALTAPGALDKSTQYFAVATTEGIVLVNRAAPATSRLVRTPPSCNGGQVSDPALSPSGRKIAMLCGGHVYVAEPAADGGTTDRL